MNEPVQREHALLVLRDRYADGVLTLEDYSARVGRVLDAARQEEVDQAVEDLDDAALPFDPWLAPHLLAGERVLWAGRPDARSRLTREDVVRVPFSIFWCGFAILWETIAIIGAIKDPAAAFFPVFGLAFVAVGCYLVYGRFAVERRIRLRRRYAVTDRRVLVVERKASGEEVDAAFLNALPGLSTRVRRDGSGSVYFTASGSPAESRFAWAPSRALGPAFLDVPDAREVATLVGRLRDDAAARAA